MTEASASPRLLSIQSHVVHGHVGNKCAVFPLQLLGFEVDFVNSVQFSNHTGYSSFQGQVMTGDQLAVLREGLEANELTGSYQGLLTGYIGSTSMLEQIVETIEKLRVGNKDFKYLCDPVLGDGGKLYVPEELVELYRTKVIQHATILTPNQFEAELLTGNTIRSYADALSACQALHERGPSTVVITSMDIPEGGNADEEPKFLTLLASTTVPQDNGGSQRIKATVPRIPAYFTGTGDLLAALLLAWGYRHPTSLETVVGKALSTLQAVLKRTAGGGRNEEGLSKSAVMAGRELKLIQSRDDIIAPPDISVNGIRIEPVD